MRRPQVPGLFAAPTESNTYGVNALSLSFLLPRNAEARRSIPSCSTNQHKSNIYGEHPRDVSRFHYDNAEARLDSGPFSAKGIKD
jgi:hypothetical protein